MTTSIVAFINPSDPTQLCGCFSLQFTAADIAKGASQGGSSGGFSLLAEVGGQWGPSLHCLLTYPYQGNQFVAELQLALPANQQLTANSSGFFLYNQTPPAVGSVTEILRWDGIAGAGVFSAPFSLPVPQSSRGQPLTAK